MNHLTKTPEKREADHQNAVKTSYELCDQFILESVNFFADDNQIFDSIRSLRKIKFQWMNLETGTHPDAKKKMIEEINNIVTLLLEIGEGRARCTEAICNSFEHAED